MGRVKRVEPVIAFCAVISRHADAPGWVRPRLETLLGPLEPVDAGVPFEAEAYYREEMGSGICKHLIAAEMPCDPAGLADWKLATNAMEREYAETHDHPEPRPINLDPGYISQGKLVLATVKDRDHRIYLRDGIFAEVTLRYLRTGWTDNPWTYRDYRSEVLKQFAGRCRERLRAHLVAADGFRR